MQIHENVEWEGNDSNIRKFFSSTKLAITFHLIELLYIRDSLAGIYFLGTYIITHEKTNNMKSYAIFYPLKLFTFGIVFYDICKLFLFYKESRSIDSLNRKRLNQISMG